MSEQSRRNVDDLMNWLVDRIAAELQTPAEKISVEESFSNLGMTSLQTLLVTGDLGEHLGVEELEPSLFWDYPTIQKLADHLVAQRQSVAGV
jgi:acyl carrier protein